MYAANSASVNINGRIISINGRNSINSSPKYLTTVYHSYINDLNVLPSSYYPTHSNIARACHGAAIVNGKVYVIGGMNSYGLVNTVEEIDLGWQEKAPLPIPLKNFYTIENNGKLYALGGETLVSGVNQRSKAVYEYDPLLNTWSSKANLPFYTETAVFTSAYGKIYLMGGRMSSTVTGSLSFITNIYEYNPLTDIWTQKCAVKVQKRNFASIFFKGKIYSVGGYASASVEIYDPLTDATASKNNLTATMEGGRLYVLDDMLYLLKGNLMYVYNETSDTWTDKSPSGGKSFSLNCVVYNSLYAVYTTSDRLNVPYIYRYSVADNKWSSYRTFAFYGTFKKITSINNKIYIFAGSGDYADRLAEYMPSASDLSTENWTNISFPMKFTICLNLLPELYRSSQN